MYVVPLDAGQDSTEALAAALVVELVVVDALTVLVTIVLGTDEVVVEVFTALVLSVLAATEVLVVDVDVLEGLATTLASLTKATVLTKPSMQDQYCYTSVIR